jgi:non-specific serine/threonine protein kinase
VRALLGESRLVTLTGMGGAGKTRLALEAAAELADGPGDGAWFADLAPLSDPDLVAVTVADVLGVRLEPGRAGPEALASAVGDQSLLVVLDNCEHVIGSCAKLADVLLHDCPNLALLATSREPLGIAGEHVYRVPSLGVPAEDADAAAVRASEAVRLLSDRAAAQGVRLSWDEDSAAVAGRICRRLDGIPLAIELAAARLRMMPAQDLEDRLGERFALLTGGPRAALPRQRTLRAMVDWSWDLLTGAEQALLARLSVFAGSFGLAAAEAVAAGSAMPAAEILEVLGALVDKSLVHFGAAGAGQGRYRLLETVRHYAAGQLNDLGPAAADAARLAHRRYYLALAEEAAPYLETADQAEWLDRLDTEVGNLRAAADASLAEADVEPGLRLAVSLQMYWNIRGHSAEGVSMLRALLDRPAAQAVTLPRAQALAAAARLLTQTNDYALAADYCQEALDIARPAGDELLTANVLYTRALALLRQGHVGIALPLVESGLDLARRLKEPRLRARLLYARAYARNAEGDPERAASDISEALQLLRQAGDPLQTGQMLGNLGYGQLSAGDLDAARGHLAEALDIARTLNNRIGLVYGTFNLGLAKYLDGSPQAAGILFAESLDLARRTGARAQAAYALLGLALAGHGGDGPGWAARLHGAADQVLADLGETLEPLEARLAGQDRERLRAAMGDAAFDAEYAAGRTLNAPQVLAMLKSAGTAARQAPPTESGEAETRLTPRELDVLRLVAQGLSNPDIARRLVLSEHTIHRHLANILHKLGLSSRAAAAAWGVRTGLV